MADNRAIGGFRVAKTGNIVTETIETHPVASAYATAIFTGDVVKRVSGGTLEAAAAGDTDLFGICVGVEQYWDGKFMRGGDYLPASTTYGTVFQRESRIRVVRFSRDLVLEVDCDDSSTATSYSAYRAFIDENCDLVVGSGGNTTSGRSSYALDISTHVATAAQFRIREIPYRNFQDFSGANVKLWVSVNESHLFTTAGV